MDNKQCESNKRTIKLREFGNDLMKDKGTRDNGQREVTFLCLSYSESSDKDTLLTNQILNVLEELY